MYSIYHCKNVILCLKIYLIIIFLKKNYCNKKYIVYILFCIPYFLEGLNNIINKKIELSCCDNIILYLKSYLIIFYI